MRYESVWRIEVFQIRKISFGIKKIINVLRTFSSVQLNTDFCNYEIEQYSLQISPSSIYRLQVKADLHPQPLSSKNLFSTKIHLWIEQRFEMSLKVKKVASGDLSWSVLTKRSAKSGSKYVCWTNIKPYVISYDSNISYYEMIFIRKSITIWTHWLFSISINFEIRKLKIHFETFKSCCIRGRLKLLSYLMNN